MTVQESPCTTCASQNYCKDMCIPAYVNKTGCAYHILKLDETGETDHANHETGTDDRVR